MTAGRFVFGSVCLFVDVAALVWGAGRVRRRAVPDATGPLAVLAVIVLAFTGAIIVCELLGTVGLFRFPAVVMTTLVAGLAAGWVAGSPVVPVSTPSSSSAERTGWRSIPNAATVVGVAFATASVLTSTLRSYRSGILESDSLSYHLSMAARFAQSGWTTRLHYIAPQNISTFHPATVELVHGIGLLAYRGDVLSPAINLGFVALALLAGWCIGRPFGVSQATCVATAAFVGIPIMSYSQGGTAMNDLAATAFFLSAIALLVADRRGTGTAWIAGLAAGLALGTKLTVLGPVGALAVVAVVHAGRARWLGHALRWSAGLLIGGGFWFVRNLVRTGNPVPVLHLPGLPTTGDAVLARYGFSVLHYITDPPALRIFRSGLHHAFGPTWWLLVVLAAVALVGGLLSRGDNGLPRTLAIVSAASGFAYLVTPTSAIGPPGRPVLFWANTRYAAPAIALALIVLPLIPFLRRGSARTVVPAVLAAYTVVEVMAAGQIPARPTIAAALLTAALGCAIAVIVVVRVRAGHTVARAVVVGATAAAVVVGAAGVGWYGNHRYAGPQTPMFGAVRVLNREHNVRVGYAGFFRNYELTGSDASNVASYVGLLRPDHSVVDAPNCATFRRLVRHGAFRFLVIAPAFPASPLPREAAWADADPHARVLVREPGLRLYAIDRSSGVDDEGCT